MFILCCMDAKCALSLCVNHSSATQLCFVFFSLPCIHPHTRTTFIKWLRSGSDISLLYQTYLQHGTLSRPCQTKSSVYRNQDPYHTDSLTHHDEIRFGLMSAHHANWNVAHFKLRGNVCLMIAIRFRSLFHIATQDIKKGENRRRKLHEGESWWDTRPTDRVA